MYKILEDTFSKLVPIYGNDVKKQTFYRSNKNITEAFDILNDNSMSIDDYIRLIDDYLDRLVKSASESNKLDLISHGLDPDMYKCTICNNYINYYRYNYFKSHGLSTGYTCSSKCQKVANRLDRIESHRKDVMERLGDCSSMYGMDCMNVLDYVTDDKLYLTNDKSLYINMKSLTKQYRHIISLGIKFIYDNYDINNHRCKLCGALLKNLQEEGECCYYSCHNIQYLIDNPEYRKYQADKLVADCKHVWNNNHDYYCIATYKREISRNKDLIDNYFYIAEYLPDDKKYKIGITNDITRRDKTDYHEYNLVPLRTFTTRKEAATLEYHVKMKYCDKCTELIDKSLYNELVDYVNNFIYEDNIID